MVLFLIGVQCFQGRDEVVDASELAVNGCEPDVGHFADLFEIPQHEFTDLGAAHFLAGALLEFQFEFFHEGFEPRGVQARFLASSIQAVQQLAATEDFTVAVAFDHRDRNGLHPFVGGEAKFTVEAFTPSSHAASTIRCPGFENATICVLAGGALHPRGHQLVAPTVDTDLRLEKGLVDISLI